MTVDIAVLPVVGRTSNVRIGLGEIAHPPTVCRPPPPDGARSSCGGTSPDHGSFVGNESGVDEGVASIRDLVDAVACRSGSSRHVGRPPGAAVPGGADGRDRRGRPGDRSRHPGRAAAGDRRRGDARAVRGDRPAPVGGGRRRGHGVAGGGVVAGREPRDRALRRGPRDAVRRLASRFAHQGAAVHGGGRHRPVGGVESDPRRGDRLDAVGGRQRAHVRVGPQPAAAAGADRAARGGPRGPGRPGGGRRAPAHRPRAARPRRAHPGGDAPPCHRRPARAAPRS